MKRVWYWLLIAVVTSVVTHLAYVLYAPRYQMSRLLAALTEAAPVNQFTVLGRESQAALFAEDAPSLIRAVCPFDLSQGAIAIRAALPDAPWVAAIHGENGAVIYVLSREQAGVPDIAITIRPAGGLLASNGSEDQPSGINDGWTLEAEAERGLAVISVMLPNPLDRQRAERRLRTSSCGKAPQA